MSTDNATPMPEVHPSARDLSQESCVTGPLGRRAFLALGPALALGAQCPLLPYDAVQNPRDTSDIPFCVCMEIMADLEIFIIKYDIVDEAFVGAPVLTDAEGRLLYCTDPEAIPRMLDIGRADLVCYGEPDLEELIYISIPDVLEEHRDLTGLRRTWEVLDLFDTLTDLLKASGYTYSEGIYNFMMGCFSHACCESPSPWDHVVSQRGHKNLTASEGIQLALGIVLTHGRYVA